MSVDNWQQLDLFGIAEANDWQNKVQSNTFTLDDIRIGDRFEVHWSNGVRFTGTFVTHGWWQVGRKDIDYYWLETEGHDFRPMSPRDEWVYLGRDDSYTPPCKDNIFERLVDVLKQVPLDKRIPAFQNFEKQYPHLSAEYFPVVHEAWSGAIVAVTSLDELLSYYPSWTDKAQFPIGKGDVIRDFVRTVFQRSPDEWKNELLKLRWTEGGGKDGFSVYRFSARDWTYYRPLYLHYLTECRTADELLKLMIMRGSESSWDKGMKSNARVWLDESDPDNEQQISS